MTTKNLADAFYEELRDILSAEKQLVEALPKMAESAHSPDLQKAFTHHLKETKKQVERVEAAFAETGKAARAKTCEAMKGLIKEGSSIIKQDAAEDVRDALLIAAAQKVEHYEIATYGTLCAWAKELGYTKALSLLKENIDEEKNADNKLQALSKQINKEALQKAA